MQNVSDLKVIDLTMNGHSNKNGKTQLDLKNDINSIGSSAKNELAPITTAAFLQMQNKSKDKKLKIKGDTHSSTKTPKD